jgi:sulfur-carrier protein
LASVRLRLPVGITGSSGPSYLECEGATVGDALKDCVSREPRLHSRIYHNGEVWVGIFVNGRNVREGLGLQTPLNDGDEIRLLPPVSGG